ERRRCTCVWARRGRQEIPATPAAALWPIDCAGMIWNASSRRSFAGFVRLIHLIRRPRVRPDAGSVDGIILVEHVAPVAQAADVDEVVLHIRRLRMESAV